MLVIYRLSAITLLYNLQADLICVSGGWRCERYQLYTPWHPEPVWKQNWFGRYKNLGRGNPWGSYKLEGAHSLQLWIGKCIWRTACQDSFKYQVANLPILILFIVLENLLYNFVELLQGTEYILHQIQKKSGKTCKL